MPLHLLCKRHFPQRLARPSLTVDPLCGTGRFDSFLYKLFERKVISGKGVMTDTIYQLFGTFQRKLTAISVCLRVLECAVLLSMYEFNLVLLLLQQNAFLCHRLG